MSTPAPTAPTVAQALAAARALGLDRTDAHTLLAHVLGRGRAWLLAHDDAILSAAQMEAYGRACGQRADGMPVAYLTGRQGFHGLELSVGPDVLVPRPDTETLVEWALACMPAAQAAAAARGRAPCLLDLGTGSGAIALALARAAGVGWHVTATDLSAAALRQAQANALRLGLRLGWRQGDWWQALAQGARFELIVSNPPYIAAGDAHLPALRHEPALALVSGAQGLEALRTLAAGARQHLQPGAWLLLEHGHDQADAVATLLQAGGLVEVQHRHDLAGIRRCTGGRAPGGT